MTIKRMLTDNPKQKPDEAELGFGKIFTDHMFVMEYSGEQGWHDPVIKPYSPLELDPSAMVLHYGQAVFEGLKCYRANDGRLLLFRPEMNFKRLNVSDERLCIPYLDEDMALQGLNELLQVDKDWIPSMEGTTLYIRPFVIATEPGLGVRPADNYLFIIILSPVGAYYKEGLSPTKIMIEDEYVRAVKGGIGFTKSTANYAMSLKGQVKAKEHGYTQTLWLDGIHRKYIEEVGTSNVFFKIDGKIITPALTGSILPGVTRDSSIQLLRSWGYSVVEREIEVGELYAAYENDTLEEAFATGTAAVVSPIGEFAWDGKKIIVGDGGIGDVSMRLYDTLTGIQYGRLKDEFGWVREVR